MPASIKHWRRQLALPNLAAARLPQQKIFDDPLVFAGRKRRTANPAHHLRVIGSLRTGLGFDDLIKSTAIRASEMNFRGFGHAPTRQGAQLVPKDRMRTGRALIDPADV